MYKKHHVHFVGIGGIGMSGIAEVLINLGYPVSGSDLKNSPILDRLRQQGAQIFLGHKATHLQNAEIVVVSSAVQKDNEEVKQALKKKLVVIPRAAMLAEIMRLTKYGIAVAGTHGKTTTTSFLGSILSTAKLDPTLIIGGRLNSMGSNARLGRGDYMVAEADESDGSFLHLLPTIAIVTNIDPEHMDYYKNFDNYRQAFFDFCQTIPFYGLVVLCGEHPETMKLAQKLKKRTLIYGLQAHHDFNARQVQFDGLSTHFDLYKKNEFVGKITNSVPGMHNVLNALASIAVADEIGIPFGKIQKALREFKGVGRRMEILHASPEITVIDDYGHHPAEIEATLKAIRKAFPGRLVALFQPHRYTRTRDCFEQFLSCFDLADFLIITDIYSAGEKPITGINSKNLVKELKRIKGEQVVYLPHTDDIAQKIVQLLKPDDIFLSLGAGSVTKVGHEVAALLEKKIPPSKKT